MRSNSKKGLVCLAVACIVAQIATDLAHSVTVFPLVHYGMFSESFSRPDSLVRYEVTVNGQALDPREYRIYQWDMVQQPLTAFDRKTGTNDFDFDKSKFRKALPSIYAAVSANLDNAAAADAGFPEWYRRYLSTVIGMPVRSLQVNRCIYGWRGTQFILERKTPWIVR